MGKISSLIFLANLVFIAPPMANAADVLVEIGKPSVLKIPIRNNISSVDSADAEVTIELPTALQGHLSLDFQNSDLGPTLIAPDSSHEFTLAYVVGTAAPEGTHEAKIKVNLSNVKFEPELVELDTSVNFTIDPTMRRASSSA